MKLITFNYTKAPGKVSARVLLTLTVPNTMYEGIDISELDQEEQALFSYEMDKAREAYIDAMAVIQDKFDVKTNYRRFDPSKMSEVLKEVL
jgi:hypothetical protein